jgi:hypothetical protein
VLPERCGMLVQGPRGGSDATRRGEVGALPHRCSFLLGGALAAVLMKGPRWLSRRGPSMGVAAMATTMRSWRRRG